MSKVAVRIAFLLASVFAFYVGWVVASLVFLSCAILGYSRVTAMVRNLWCGILPYKMWTDEKPQGYISYFNHLKQRIKAIFRWLTWKETLADVSIEDSFQVSFSDFFQTNKEQRGCCSAEVESEYGNNLYGAWKEGNPNEWKESK